MTIENNMFKAFIKDTPFGISILLLVLTVGFIALIAPIGGNKALIVRSGSMQPTINVGDLVVVQTKKSPDSPIPKIISANQPSSAAISSYNVGDIVAFKSDKNPKLFTTHRIVGKEIKDNRIFYETRGDANKSADKVLVPQENIIGAKFLLLPKVGKLVAFTKSNIGFPLLVIFPALAVILLEFAALAREIRKQRSPSNSNFVAFKALIPFLASVLIISPTFAFFSDSETSTDNIFTAAESFCNSTEGDVVINEVFYNVDTSHNGKGSENNWEWVELYNPTSETKTLTGWKIADSNQTDSFPVGTITLEPCSFAIVSPVSKEEFTDQSNDGGRWTIPDSVVFINIGSFIGNGLPPGGDAVILKNAGNVVIDAMSYGTNTSQLNPSVPDVASGHSLEREPDGVDTDSAGDFVDRTTPSPGS